MILKNGKRIDGCTDTLPVGTVQPFLGLTPPLGYLICQGQLISKVKYPELYNICKSTFGAETETHFYLPDLRGKTVAGYYSGDDTFNILGLSLGEKTHLLTELESGLREHTHPMPLAHSAGVGSYSDVAVRAVQSVTDNEFRTGRVTGLNPNLDRDYGSPYVSGTRDANAVNAHNNIQPTMVLNWIVKAAMLIPEYFTVENTLTSTSTSNALSAAQGKILSDKVNNCLSRSGGTVSGNLISYYHDFLISANEFNFASGSYNNGSIYFNYRAGTSDADATAGPITNYYFYNGQREMATNVYAKYFQSSNGTLLGTNNFYVITGTTAAPDSGGNAELMNVPSDVYVISIKPTNNINAIIVPYYPGNGYEHWYVHVLKSYGTAVTSVSYAALVYKPS